MGDRITMTLQKFSFINGIRILGKHLVQREASRNWYIPLHPNNLTVSCSLWPGIRIEFTSLSVITAGLSLLIRRVMVVWKQNFFDLRLKYTTWTTRWCQLPYNRSEFGCFDKENRDFTPLWDYVKDRFYVGKLFSTWKKQQSSQYG